MKNKLTLSAAALGMLCSVNVSAADSLSGMFSEGKTSGQIRAFFIDRDDTTKAGKQTATAIGGHLKFETADYEGLSIGSAFYTTNRILQDLEDDKMGPNTTLLKNDGSSYSILGEAYLQYKRANTALKIGRQKLNTPMAGADDARMIPNMFEAYVLSNTDLANTTLIAAHVTKFAAGTFANAYNGGIVGATGGYTGIPGNTAKYQGEFTNMGTWAVGEATAGVTTIGAIYKGENYKVQLWDYYAHDILNAIYGQADLSWKCLLTDSVKPFIAGQFIKENGVGDKLLSNVTGDGEIDSLYGAVKLGAKVENFALYGAYSQTTVSKASDAVYAGAIITPWGGMPAFTQGMVTRHMFLAGTKATKVAASYNFKDLGVNLSAAAYYAMFDLHKNGGLGDIETKEPGFDVKYYPAAVKNLQLRFRGNFPEEFANDRDWGEYRFIANYNF